MEQHATLSAYVYGQLLADIYNRKYKYSEKLPSLEKLCEKYHVGRNTVRTAIQKLEADGLLISSKGSAAVVSFNLNEPEQRNSYRNIIVAKRKSIKEVFETLGIIMPEIISECLRDASAEQRKILESGIKTIRDNDSLTNELQLKDTLLELYLTILSFLENPLIHDLFYHMIQFVFFPLTEELRDDGNLQSNIIRIKKILMNAFSIILKGKLGMLQKVIKVFCAVYQEKSLSYIDKIREDRKVDEDINFTWYSNRQSEFLYNKVVIHILDAINQKEYCAGDLLPSIDVVAKQYHVSPRTVRKAMKALNQVRVIETINGVGSRVYLDFYNSQSTCNQHETLQLILKQYDQALQLLTLLVRSYSAKDLLTICDEDLEKIIDYIEGRDEFFVQAIIHYILSHSNDCMQMIYQELNKSLVMMVLVQQVLQQNDSYYTGERERVELLKALRKKDFKKAYTIVNKVMEISCDLSKQALAFLS